ncbi:MAG: hypothetical protein A3G80_00500 [Betaproteobacteria bacterium RIFCSPLOWO2_12_FULL_62_13b]|nr:MAG: hypothetical protein A3G80_00500 [Betaproteobacteria bacterium RIFCSPLOWO2_12_FULL_62_13b]
MIGKRDCRADMRRTSDALHNALKSMQARRQRADASAPARSAPAMAAAMLLLALVLQCVEPRAELLFRSADEINGRQHWSALRNYANPPDTAYLRALADGTQVAAEEVQVFLHGYITSADVYGAKVMESLLKKGRQKIAGNLVSFAGNGGEVDAAMELGRILRKLGVSTVVAEGDQCLSSCVFAFMGGDRRAVAGRLGIHRPYFSSARDVPDRRSHYRQLQKRLQEYIEELDFPSSFYEAVMAVPPQSVNILTPSDLKRFYLEGMSPSTQDEADAATARGLGISVAEYLQRKTAASGAAVVAPTTQQNGETASGNSAVGRLAGQVKIETEGAGASRGATGSP